MRHTGAPARVPPPAAAPLDKVRHRQPPRRPLCQSRISLGTLDHKAYLVLPLLTPALPSLYLRLPPRPRPSRRPRPPRRTPSSPPAATAPVATRPRPSRARPLLASPHPEFDLINADPERASAAPLPTPLPPRCPAVPPTLRLSAPAQTAGRTESSLGRSAPLSPGEASALPSRRTCLLTERRLGGAHSKIHAPIADPLLQIPSPARQNNGTDNPMHPCSEPCSPPCASLKLSFAVHHLPSEHVWHSFISQ